MSGMNLVHRVGVIFEAQDHLSSKMDKMGNKFTGLEAKQKAFERSQRSATQSARQLERAENGLTQALQRQLGLSSQLKAAENSRLAASLKYTTMRKSADESYAKTKMALEKDLTKFTETQEAERASVRDGFEKRSLENAKYYQAIQTKSQGVLASQRGIAMRSRAKLSSAALQEDAVKFGFASPDAAMSARDELVVKRNLLAASVKRLETRKARTIAKAMSKYSASNPKATPEDRDIERGRASRLAEDKIASTRKDFQFEQQKIVYSNKVTELVVAELEAEEEITSQEALQLESIQCAAEAEKVIYDERLAAEAHLEQLQADRMAAKTSADLAELTRADSLYAAQLTHIEELKARETELAELRQTALDAQVATTATLIESNTALTAVLATQVEEEAAIIAAQTERLSLLERIKGVYSEIAHGAGMMLGGAMVLGAIAYGGNHVVEKAADYELLKNKVFNNIYGQTQGKGGPLWSSIINSAIEKSNGTVQTSAGPMEMSPRSQYEIINDQLTQGIAAPNALKNLPGITEMVRYGAINGTSLAAIAKNLPMIYEYAGVRSQKDTDAINEHIVKNMAISNRLTFPALQQGLMKTAIPLRNMGIDIGKSIPLLDYQLSTMSANKASTADRSFFQALESGGTSDKGRELLSMLTAKGLFRRGKATPIVDWHNKPMLDKHGKPLMMQGSFNFNDKNGEKMGAMQVLASIADTLVQKFGGQDVMHSQPAQRQKANQLLNEMFSAIRGRTAIAPFLDPIERSKMDIDLAKAAHAPGLAAQLGSKSNLYKSNMATFTQDWDKLMTSLGKSWLPTMSALVVVAAKFVKATAGVTKAHPVAAQGTLLGGIALAVGSVLAGVARMIGGLWGAAKGGATWLWSAAKWGATELAPKALAMFGVRGATAAGATAAGATAAGATAAGATAAGATAAADTGLVAALLRSGALTEAVEAGGTAMGLTASAALTGGLAVVGGLIAWAIVDYIHKHPMHLNSKAQDQRVHAALKAGNVHAAHQIVLGGVNKIPDLLHSSQTHLPASSPQGRIEVHVKLDGLGPNTNQGSQKVAEHIVKGLRKHLGDLGTHSLPMHGLAAGQY